MIISGHYFHHISNDVIEGKNPSKKNLVHGSIFGNSIYHVKLQEYQGRADTCFFGLLDEHTLEHTTSFVLGASLYSRGQNFPLQL